MMMERRARLFLRSGGSAGSAALVSLTALLIGAGVGCSSTEYIAKPVAQTVIPIKDTTPQPKAPEHEQPPASGPAKPYAFPVANWSETAGGLKIAAIPNKALPVVQIRVVVKGGKAADGEKPGLVGI